MCPLTVVPYGTDIPVISLFTDPLSKKKSLLACPSIGRKICVHTVPLLLLDTSVIISVGTISSPIHTVPLLLGISVIISVHIPGYPTRSRP